MNAGYAVHTKVDKFLEQHKLSQKKFSSGWVYIVVKFYILFIHWVFTKRLENKEHSKYKVFHWTKKKNLQSKKNTFIIKGWMCETVCLRIRKFRDAYTCSNILSLLIFKSLWMSRKCSLVYTKLISIYFWIRGK